MEYQAGTQVGFIVVRLRMVRFRCPGMLHGIPVRHVPYPNLNLSLDSFSAGGRAPTVGALSAPTLLYSI